MPFVVGGSLAGPSIGIGGGQGLDVKAKWTGRAEQMTPACPKKNNHGWPGGRRLVGARKVGGAAISGLPVWHQCNQHMRKGGGVPWRWEKRKRSDRIIDQRLGLIRTPFRTEELLR